MTRIQTTYVLFLAVAAALLLASNQIGRPEGWSLTGVYGYWTSRVLIEAALFVAFADLLSRVPLLRLRPVLTCFLAAVVSLFPFVLSITALDLILGLPELGGTIDFAALSGPANTEAQAGSTRVGSFLRELVYLSDNHLALCLLLSAPRLLPALVRAEDRPGQEPGRQTPDLPTEHAADREADPLAREADAVLAQTDDKGYRRHLDRPLEGALLRVEAQEHYIRLISQSETRMLLYRFNDIVAELPSELGMQVHRSHWVAYTAVNTLAREGGRLFLALKDGTRIPVSRKYAEPVRSHFVEDATEAKGAVS